MSRKPAKAAAPEAPPDIAADVSDLEKTVEQGDFVHVHYRGMLEDDSVFDTSEGREPLGFEAGAGDVIKGFDEAVMGMRVGETKRVVIPPEEGYGPWRPELLQQVDRAAAGDAIVLPGMQVRMHSEDDDVEGVVTDVGDDTFTVDVNHPLAGKVLTFEITVVEVEPPRMD